MQVEKELALGKQIISDVLAQAKKEGATSAEASFSKVQGLSVSSRMRDVENIEFTQDNSLGISVYLNQHKGSASTADMSPEAIKLAVRKAVHIARFTSEDPFAGLADEQLMAKDFIDLELYYQNQLDTPQAIELVKETEGYALDFDHRITNSDGASYNANQGVSVYGNSHGILAGQPSSRYSLSCMILASQEEQMERDYAYTVNRNSNALQSARSIGVEAAKSAISRLGAKKLKTQSCPVVFNKDLASSLFGHLVSAISGGSLYRRSSFLLDALGQKIFPDWLTIEERPHILGGLASSTYDNEGVATYDLDIIQNGVLSHYLYTSYSARKLNTQTNGHAGGIHNWLVSHTQHSDQELLEEMGTGLLVTELMGQGVNTVTGDYSRGAAGFWVENGQISHPVHEITIAGNLKDMFANIRAIGKDKDVRGAVQTGAILVDGMQVAGD